MSLLAAICRYAAAQSPAYLRNFNQFCLLSTAGQRGAGRRRAEKSHPLDVTFGGSRGLQLFSKPAPAPLSPCYPARAGSSEAQDINYPFIHYLLLALFSLQSVVLPRWRGMCSTGDSDRAPSSALPALDIDCGHFIDNI